MPDLVEFLNQPAVVALQILSCEISIEHPPGNVLRVLFETDNSLDFSFRAAESVEKGDFYERAASDKSGQFGISKADHDSGFFAVCLFLDEAKEALIGVFDFALKDSVHEDSPGFFL